MRKVTEQWEVVSSYPDQQAVDDGVLVVVNGEGKVNRVTRAVFDTYTDELGGGVVRDCTTLLNEVIPHMVAQPMDREWRTGEWKAGETRLKLWLLPNEVNGYTLMFPEDY